LECDALVDSLAEIPALLEAGRPPQR
jgi:hypothetical protein